MICFLKFFACNVFYSCTTLTLLFHIPEAFNEVIGVNRSIGEGLGFIISRLIAIMNLDEMNYLTWSHSVVNLFNVCLYLIAKFRKQNNLICCIIDGLLRSWLVMASSLVAYCCGYMLLSTT